MKDSLAKGLSVTRQIHVDRERAIDSMGEKARVYATPMLVLDIDRISRELLLGHLDAGEDSVSTRVEVDHLAATLMGMDVEITVTVAEVKGRAISLEVEGRDSIEPVCRGRHNRFVVGVDTTLARLAAKAQKAGLA
ncbi:MAG: LysR family transcriptional regulator [Burkholderiales bacterium]|jgi:predicted thioesterase|nr:MAG: LysR family transcriptional regulator [Burkholderiales bacterium]